jgi:hypothetical protein
MKSENPNPSSRPFSNWVVFPVLYVALLAYFYSFMEYGFNIWDEGGFANGTLRTLHGENICRDVIGTGLYSSNFLALTFSVCD